MGVDVRAENEDAKDEQLTSVWVGMHTLRKVRLRLLKDLNERTRILHIPNPS